MFTAEQLKQWLNTHHQQAGETTFDSVSIDSRTLSKNALFFAIQGPNFDGHDFCQKALEQGAAAVVVSRKLDLPADKQWIVPDTQEALCLCAQYYRASCTHNQLIAITGSNGKTTTKSLLNDILSPWQPTTTTHANENNHLGVALQLFKVKADHQYTVLECGTSHFGELARISDMAQPDIVLITNTSLVHTEHFGDHQGVVREKGALAKALKPHGSMIIPQEDAGTEYWKKTYHQANIMTFGLNDKADVYAQGIKYDDRQHASFTCHSPQGTFPVTLALPGSKQVLNALAAISAAFMVKCPPEAIASGLKASKPISGRMEIKPGPHGAVFIDDGYNASPNSTAAALHYLAGTKTKKIAVLSDMLELGEHSIKAHQDIGQLAKKLHIDRLFAYGQHSKEIVAAFGQGGQHFPTPEALAQVLSPMLDDQTTVLFKASRGMTIEQVMHQLNHLASTTNDL